MNQMNVNLAVRVARAHLAAVSAVLAAAPDQLEAARAALAFAKQELAAAKACIECGRGLTTDVNAYIENDRAEAVAEAEAILTRKGK